MPRTRNAPRFLLFAARYASSGVPRHVEAGERKLERRTHASWVASISGLHAVATDRTSDELRPGCTNLVRWSAPSGEIQRNSLPGADTATAVSNAGKWQDWSAWRLSNARAVHSQRDPNQECALQCRGQKRSTAIEADNSQARGLPAMGNLHDHQQHLGVQHAWSRVQVGAVSHQKFGGSGKPRRQFPAQCRSTARRGNSARIPGASACHRKLA